MHFWVFGCIWIFETFFQVSDQGKPCPTFQRPCNGIYRSQWWEEDGIPVVDWRRITHSLGCAGLVGRFPTVLACLWNLSLTSVNLHSFHSLQHTTMPTDYSIVFKINIDACFYFLSALSQRWLLNPQRMHDGSCSKFITVIYIECIVCWF